MAKKGRLSSPETEIGKSQVGTVAMEVMIPTERFCCWGVEISLRLALSICSKFSPESFDVEAPVACDVNMRCVWFWDV